MNLICKNNISPEITEDRGLLMFKHRHVVVPETKYNLTIGKEYLVNFYTHTTGFNYVNTVFRVAILTDNRKWEYFDFESDKIGFEFLDSIFNLP